MKDRGHNRDPKQCHVKLKELRQANQKTREANGRSGSEPQTCRFYDELHAILGGSATTTPTVLFDSFNGDGGNTEAGFGDEEDDDDEVLDSSQQASGETGFPDSQELESTECDTDGGRCPEVGNMGPGAELMAGKTPSRIGVPTHGVDPQEDKQKALVWINEQGQLQAPAFQAGAWSGLQNGVAVRVPRRQFGRSSAALATAAAFGGRAAPLSGQVGGNSAPALPLLWWQQFGGDCLVEPPLLKSSS
ncbi:hypothetical protein UY3_00452 [Chelonia mydas]|uniref:Myb/SANT-like DNA-binding domain-containing protein n=1 Tax=Chelonia mydas TaxID=8469 RepID=M7CM71_CHEMY|nr:hypothetical protein UY3_00452 [Chelonia mydas]